MPATRKALLPILDDDGQVIGDMPVEMSEQCATCKRWKEGMTCEAFPGGDEPYIPAEIWSGRHDHTKPFEGDNGKRYVPI